MRKNTVVSLPRLTLPELRTGSVHSPGQRLRGSRNEVWLCPAYCGADEHMLYVKPNLTVRQVVAEVVVAQIAIGMGLPCPQPFLVSVAPHCVGRPRGRALVAFGSEQVGPRGLATPIRSRDIMLEMLRKLKLSEATTVLDEFVANDVRGPGDVVFDPMGSVWLIDHEASLPKGINHDTSLTNWLGDRLRDDTEPHKRVDLLSALRAQAIKVRKLQLGPTPASLDRLVGGKDSYNQALEFLHNRLTALDYLLSKRALPDQGYLLKDFEPIEHDSQRAADL